MGGRRPRAARQLPVSHAAGPGSRRSRALDDRRRRDRARRWPRFRRDAGGSGTGSRPPADRRAGASPAGGRNRHQRGRRGRARGQRAAGAGDGQAGRRDQPWHGRGPGTLRRGSRIESTSWSRARTRRRSRRGSGGEALHLLCVAALAPRKGHELLFHALASIPQRHWRLTCVGSLERHPGMAETLRTLARTLNLDGQIVFAGEATAATLPAFYASADVFVLPTLYEGYGMAVAEALARGLPVVSTKTGAIAELVGGTAGIARPAGRRACPRAGLVQRAGRRFGRSSAACGRRPPGARHAADMGRCREQDGRRAEPGGGLMGEFSADWLALREPSDARARSAALTGAIADRLAGRPACSTSPPAQAPTSGISRGFFAAIGAAGTGCSWTTIRRCWRKRPSCWDRAKAVETRAVRLVGGPRSRRRQPVRRPGPRHGVGAARSRVGALAGCAGRPMRAMPARPCCSR